MESAAAALPVPLVCPSCGAALVEGSRCPCPAATRLEAWNGIPRLLFGQPYRGECPAKTMAEILRRLETQHWRAALAAAAPGERFEARLNSLTGPDFAHAMPWSEIETVLDVGSGMGLMTSLLAERARTVIALEPTPERALFQLKRAAQDGLANWRPVIASPDAPPFSPGSFDLITLSGGLEDEELLRRAFRLLKPGGYLYAPVRNRLALRRLLGGGRSGTLRGPARSLGRYRRMFQDAGFGAVELFGVFDACDHQKAVYGLDDARARRVTRALVDPPASRKGRLLRTLAARGPWTGLFEDEAVVFARKGKAEGRLFWSALPHEGAAAQFSSPDKVFALRFERQGAVVYKGPKTAEAVPLLAREHALLEEASRRHGDEVRSWPLRWPAPLGVLQVAGRAFYKYEFAQGTSLSSQLWPVSFRRGRFGRVFSRLVDDYVELCAKMGPDRGAAGNAPPALLERLAAVPLDDAAVAARIREACAAARRRGWPARLMHGDLSLGNARLLPDGGVVLVDWENASQDGLPAIDLVRLLNDVLDESRALPERERAAVMALARGALVRALERLGVGPDGYADLEALFVAHQFEMWLSRDAGALGSPRARVLLDRYRRRAFALEG